MVTWQVPGADKASKIVLEFAQEDFGNTCKKLSWLDLPFFLTIFFRLGGVVPPPFQMLLTAKALNNIKYNIRIFDDVRKETYPCNHIVQLGQDKKLVLFNANWLLLIAYLL